MILLQKLDLVQDLMKNHFYKFQILTNQEHLKFLTQFYKIISALWGVNDGLEDFHIYIVPIAETIEEILQVSDQELQNMNSGQMFLRVTHCVMGISQGFSDPKKYNFFFEWFHPKYFELIKRGFTAYSND